mmetsp:Transcript_30213/g.60982  ORF Transcript_30213/g.60982 Transcript_30213/m.60982 type:complete len:205 (+) Transcript_30213:398-1012(+)
MKISLGGFLGFELHLIVISISFVVVIIARRGHTPHSRTSKAIVIQRVGLLSCIERPSGLVSIGPDNGIIRQKIRHIFEGSASIQYGREQAHLLPAASARDAIVTSEPLSVVGLAELTPRRNDRRREVGNDGVIVRYPAEERVHPDTGVAVVASVVWEGVSLTGRYLNRRVDPGSVSLDDIRIIVSVDGSRRLGRCAHGRSVGRD